MEYSRLDFTAAGAANDFCSYIFESYFRKKNILSTIFSHAAVTTLILFLIIILPCFVRTPLQSTQKLATELHLADLKNKKKGGMPGATTGDPTHDKGHVEKTCQAKAEQDSRDSLDLLEHLPQNQNLSVCCLLYYAFHQFF